MFDQFPDRSGTGSLKWEKYAGRDILPFWVADMDFLSPEPVCRALHERVDHGIFGYTQPPASTVEATLAYLRNHHGLQVDKDWLVWLPGLVPALNLCCRMAGGSVLTATPVYPPFLTAPDFAGQSCIRVPLKEQDGRWTFDWQAMEAACTPETRLFLLCNPHNPVGRAFDREELAALETFILEHDLVLCSDEIHCDLILDPERNHIPAASLSPEVAQRTISLFSPSKTYNLPGLCCAFAVISDPKLRHRFKMEARGIITEVNALGFAACEAAYREGEAWRVDLIHTLRNNRDRITQRLAHEAPEIPVLPMEATYLAWFDVRKLGLDNPATHFENHGIGLSDGSFFGSPGFVRLNFGCPPAHLEAGLDRFIAGVKSARASLET